MIDHLNLPPLSRDTLCDYLVHAIATCVHELIGNILIDGAHACRPLPAREVLDRVPQASVQDWIMIATTAATTTLPVPKLLTEMRRLAER